MAAGARRKCSAVGALSSIAAHRDVRGARAVGGRAGRHQAAIDRVELVLDDPQREVVVPLLAEHVAQPADVAGGELPVAGRRALGLHQALILQEADLADRQIGELDLEVGQDIADGERGCRMRMSCAH